MTLYALVDCNSFFVSCEQIFRPDLVGAPTVVLSNNDGCIIARSKEAKAIGLPMGAPLFKYRDLIDRHRVHLFSSNFALYGDISRRVMHILSESSPLIEVYSVDEAFLEVPTKSFEGFGQSIHQRILKWVGIPVTVGFGCTKTLCKISSHIAKTKGVAYYKASIDDLKTFPVKEIWGIGRQSALKLQRAQIYTAWQLIEMPTGRLRKLLGIEGERLQLELQGCIAYPIDEEDPRNKNITVSRSFPKGITDQHALHSASAYFATKAAKKLREQGLNATGVLVYMRTDRFRAPFHSASKSCTLKLPSNTTEALIQATVTALKEAFCPEMPYKKLGIVLYGLIPVEATEANLFYSEARGNRRQRAMDLVHARYGDNSLVYASSRLSEAWRHEKNLTSPRYTSVWNELLEVS